MQLRNASRCWRKMLLLVKERRRDNIKEDHIPQVGDAENHADEHTFEGNISTLQSRRWNDDEGKRHIQLILSKL